MTGADGIEGIVLRYGLFYGPGTAWPRTAASSRTVRKRRFPVVGGGGGVWSFVHIDDVADATVAALERGAPGIYNVVDDEPAHGRGVASGAGRGASAPSRPRRVPALVGRLARRRARRGDDDRDPRRVERQGQARAGLAAPPRELARGLPHSLG